VQAIRTGNSPVSCEQAFVFAEARIVREGRIAPGIALSGVGRNLRECGGTLANVQFLVQIRGGGGSLNSMRYLALFDSSVFTNVYILTPEVKQKLQSPLTGYELIASDLASERNRATCQHRNECKFLHDEVVNQFIRPILFPEFTRRSASTA
jgi:hypothetical protein